ncbi:hypothetical protein L5515_018219 [Caenorhabditis briggsae]|uniref:Uncharacterized protein n=2 Tax=Caenorhabditis briggsae TaxID=6238 RepID=A0AAE9FIU4_CAEBR|nr:hypothetical protein L3Y34_012361 [Caenorhabditis briggsae]UMM42368.1 hypothetical protein L5515_018219 [Caenorhabditis briggsae]
MCKRKSVEIDVVSVIGGVERDRDNNFDDSETESESDSDSDSESSDESDSGNEMDNEVHDEVDGDVYDEVDGDVHDEVDGDVHDVLDGEVPDEVDNEVHREVDVDENYETAPMDGSGVRKRRRTDAVDVEAEEIEAKRVELEQSQEQHDIDEVRKASMQRREYRLNFTIDRFYALADDYPKGTYQEFIRDQDPEYIFKVRFYPNGDEIYSGLMINLIVNRKVPLAAGENSHAYLEVMNTLFLNGSQVRCILDSQNNSLTYKEKVDLRAPICYTNAPSRDAFNNFPIQQKREASFMFCWNLTMFCNSFAPLTYETSMGFF